MKDQQFTLKSYDPVYVLSPEIEIPAETIRAELLDSLRRDFCKDGEEPDLSDAWIASHADGFETLGQYEAIVRDNLDKEARHHQRFQDEDIICAALAERLVQDVPEEVVSEASFTALMRFDQFLRENGITKEEYCKRENTTEESLDKKLVDDAVQGYREEMAFAAYATHFELTLAPEDVLAVIPGDTPEEQLAQRQKIERGGGMAGLEEYALKVKAIRTVVENAMVKRTEDGEYEKLGAVSADVAEAFKADPEAFMRMS